jgi:5'-deoxynucleotidase YfbR-like HD superfamily hydrolase
MESGILPQSDEQVLEIARQLQVAYRLKRTLRYATVRDTMVHNESVAEHVFALFFLAQYFLPIEDPEGKLDAEKLYRIFIFHDFGEIVHGDVSFHLKTKEQEVLEHQAALDVFKMLPLPLQGIAHDAWKAAEDRECAEALFAYALDKIEPLFELLDPVNEQSLKRLKITYETHVGKKRLATEKFPAMRRFVEAISDDMLRRDIFWKGE